MARMNADEIAAAVARARWDGAREIETLVSSMTKLGLGLAAISGALEAQIKELGATVVAAREKAEASRVAKPEPKKEAAQTPLE